MGGETAVTSQQQADSSVARQKKQVAFATAVAPARQQIASASDLATLMEASPKKAMRVLFLSADTGGGHRASAEALAKQVRYVRLSNLAKNLLSNIPSLHCVTNTVSTPLSWEYL
jgi:hypothetical protein